MHFTLGELVLDLVHNAASADARLVTVTWADRAGRLELRVADNGRGMPPEVVARATDPFYTDGVKHPGRAVGLGLAFLRQTAEATGGTFQLDSELGRGTTVGLTADSGHVDLPPAGDAVDTVMLALTVEGPDEIVVERATDAGSYTVRKSELEEALGDLCDVQSWALLREYVRSQEDEIWQR